MGQLVEVVVATCVGTTTSRAITEIAIVRSHALTASKRTCALAGTLALGPEAGEWLQEAKLAISAHVPLDVLRDTIQPFLTFSEIYADALKALRTEIAAP